MDPRSSGLDHSRAGDAHADDLVRLIDADTSNGNELFVFASEGLDEAAEPVAQPNAIDALHPTHSMFEIEIAEHSILDSPPPVPPSGHLGHGRRRSHTRSAHPARIVRAVGYLIAVTLVALALSFAGRRFLDTQPVRVPDPPPAQAPRALVATESVEPPLSAPLETAAPPPLGQPIAVATPAAPALASTIQMVVSRYLDALAAFDVDATKAEWPGVDEAALRRTFASLDEQRFELKGCEITAAVQTATALCDGVVRYTPTVGSKTMFVQRRQWRFRLSRNGDRWSIEDVQVR